MDKTAFWKRKKLAEMTPEEWESLCDGCAKCCLEKLEDEKTGELWHTNVACRLLDLDACRCTHYQDRRRHVANCETLTPETAATFPWLPSTCAYRLLALGKDLPEWHWLVCGDAGAVHGQGHSVRGRVVSEEDAGDLDDHIVTWPV